MEQLLEERLPLHLRRRLVSSLNTNNRWSLILDGLPTYRIPVFLNLDRMNNMVKRGMSPADWLLEELFDRLCSFKEFCFMLREFDMLEELSLLTPAEPMVIEVQPGSGERVERVESGGELQLTCTASGVPRPSYQWFHENNMLQGQTNSVLTIAPFSEEHRGVYKCRVRQDISGHVSERFSCEVIVDQTAVRPYLLSDVPRVRSVPRGQSLLLEVTAQGHPPPQYEWYRSATYLADGNVDPYVMPNIVLSETSSILELKNVGSEDEGLYCCKVYNEAGETFSSMCTLSIFEHPPDYVASAKVALLIGNENYIDEELRGLHAPSNDVATLAEILDSLGFHIIALHNLTRTEMYNAFRWFCRILPEDAYAFFYFAGHGFSKLSSKFIMPIDCPKNEVTLSDCLCEDQLTQILAQGRQLQLLVMLFDCCLVESRDLAIGITEFGYDLGNCNVVVGTATRNHQNAYESEKETNGMFVNHLKSHLADEMPVIELLRENQRDFREKQQHPTLSITGADNCSLTDPVRDNPELREKLKNEVDFHSFNQQLYFSKTNERFTILISKHKKCFLNTIDLEFPESFSHNFSVEVNPQDVDLKVEQKVVTIYNVQKVKSSLCVTVFINGLRQTTDGHFEYGPYDSCEFSLDCPIIQGGLWHTPSTEY